jgi:large subunit ribosomal protein L21
MYAVIELGAKQYSVKKDDVIQVEKMDAEKNKEILLDKVLLVSDANNVEIGRPYLKSAKVSALVLKDIKDEKKITYKYRRRKAHHFKKGHRQQLTQLRITNIEMG